MGSTNGIASTYDFRNGLVATLSVEDPTYRLDLNKNVAFAANGVSYPKTVSSESLWEACLRVQRDF